MERNQRRPPDVNEALSSMLWTPYERTPSESSSDDDERLNAKLKKSQSTCDYRFPTKNTTQYVPSFRKIERYDNFRFSYPYYGQIPLVQKCITELPSYESLYQSGLTPELSSITGLQSARLVHSFTDNFLGQSRPSSAGAICDPSAAFLGITSSTSGFSNNFTDEDDGEEDDDCEDFDESSSNNNNGPIPSQSTLWKAYQDPASALAKQLYSSNAAATAIPSLSTSVAEETKKYQWPADGQIVARVDGTQSDNNGDLLLAKNNNISHRPNEQLKQSQSQQPLSSPQHPREYQLHQHQHGPTRHHLQKHQSRDQVDPKIAAHITIPTSCQDRDVAVEKIQDLPGECNQSATLHSLPTTIAQETLSVSEQCTNNGEKLDTKCVRSVQTDLVFSSSRLVEANVEVESVSSSLCSSIGFDASNDITDRVDAIVATGESHILNAFNVYDKANNNSCRDRLPLILDVRNSLLAMRLNIPAAQPSIVDPLKGTSIGSNNDNGNGGSAITTTSVFLPLNESLIASRVARNRNTISNVNAIVSATNEVQGASHGTPTVGGSAIVHAKPSLTIQVNQGGETRAIRDNAAQTSASNAEGLANNAAGISVVSCYSGSTVPNSCSVNNNNVANVVTTTTTSTSTATAEFADTVLNGTNSVNITSPNGFSGVSDTNISVLQSNGLPISPNQHHHQSNQHRDGNRHRPLARTFTSTECQTDDLPLVDRNEISAAIAQSQTEALISREQRRRERRERRQQGRTRHPHIMPHMHHQPPPPPPPPMLRPSMLPDILHSHFPPPYTALQSLANPPPPPPPSSMITPVISTVPLATATAVSDGRFTIPLPVIRRSPSERSGKGCCGQWFAGPPLRALIAVVALGGVACALGGAALGATGLAGPPTSHLTAALLMIGVGVILVTVSGAAWRMTAPGGPPCLGLGSTVDLARCGRRPCNSRGAPHGLLYPEFQHRPPPPSYQASMQEYRLRLLLLDRDRQNGVVRGGSPPPTYRSHAGSLLRAPLSTPRNALGGPGSEYSLPPSYRSRHANANTNTSISRPSTTGIGGNSMESLNSNSFPSISNNNPSIQATINNPNVPHTSATSTTLIDTLQNTVSLVPQSTSSIPVNFHSSVAALAASSTTITTPSTKDTVHTITVDAAGATRPNEQQQQHFTLIQQSQNLNEKLNPRVTNSNNNNNVNHSSSSRTNHSLTSNSSNNVSCTNAFGSPSRVTMSSIVTTMAANGAVPTKATKNEQSSCAVGNNRKELVTIVTISAPQEPERPPSEMEILAHL